MKIVPIVLLLFSLLLCGARAETAADIKDQIADLKAKKTYISNSLADEKQNLARQHAAQVKDVSFLK